MRGTFEDALLRSSARELMSGLGLASSRAVSLNQAHSFVFDRAANEFTVRAREQAPAADAESKPWIEARKLDERVTVEIRDPSETPAEIQGEEYVPSAEREPKIEQDVINFYPDGTSDRREIILRDRNNVELALRINPVTGRVRVEDMREEAIQP
jgi:Tfp pilus assembly protein FimT